MATQFFVQKPSAQAAVQYDGTNVAEINALLTALVVYDTTVVDNEDETCTITNLLGSDTLVVGDWVGLGGGVTGRAQSDAVVTAGFQEVPGTAVHYDITADGS